MRKLLIFTAGVALLSAPAFAQTAPGSTSGEQPATGAASQPAPDQGAATTGADTGQPSDVQPGTTAPNGAATPGSNVSGQPSSGPGDVSAGQQPNAQPQPYTAEPGTSGATTAPPPPSYTGGTRLYTSTNQQGVQVVSNGPVPDTHANRAKFPPLSRAGRRTKAAGN
jgi:hypothetical protein